MTFSLITIPSYELILIFNQDKADLKDYYTAGSCLTSNLKYDPDMGRMASTERREWKRVQKCLNLECISLKN